MRRALCALASLCGAVLFSACSFFPPLPVRTLEDFDDARGQDWEVHRITAPQIRESSGLVKSRRYPQVFWTHNDSGGQARIFAIDPRGRLIANFAVQGVGASDWEDIAIDDSGNLYIGDIGNNTGKRRDLVVHRVPEPNPFASDREARPDLSLPFRYADQSEFPARGWLNYDAEALIWMEGALYILTKHRCDRRSALYRLPIARTGTGEAVLESSASFHLGSMRTHESRGGLNLQGNTTAADLSPDGRVLAILTYRAIYFYERMNEGDAPFRFLRSIALRGRRTGQAESIAWDGRDIVFGNEQGWLFRIPDALESDLERYPP